VAVSAGMTVLMRMIVIMAVGMAVLVPPVHGQALKS